MCTVKTIGYTVDVFFLFFLLTTTPLCAHASSPLAIFLAGSTACSVCSQSPLANCIGRWWSHSF